MSASEAPPRGPASRQTDTTLAAAAPLPRESRRELLLVAALFLVLRLTSAVWFRPLYSEPASYFFPLYHLTGAGYYPFVHYWLEYPPALAYYLVGLRWVGRAVGGSGGAADPVASVVWQRHCFVGAVQAGSILCELGILLLVYHLARLVRGPSAAARAGLIYTCLFSTAFVALSYTDAFPILLMLLGLALAVRSRPVWAGMALAVGLMAKAIPAALLPMVLKAEGRWRWRVLALAAFLAVAAGCVAPFLPSGRPWLRCLLESMVRRPPWETVWALLDHRYEFGYVGPGLEHQTEGFFEQYGVRPGVRETLQSLPPEVFGYHAAQRRTAFYRVASRFAPSLAYVDSRPRTGRQFWWIYGIAGAVVGLFYAATFAWLPASLVPRRRLVFGAFSLFVALFYLKGWSPQFAAYLIPLLLVALPPTEAGLWSLLLTLTAFVEMPVWVCYVHPGAAAGASAWMAWLDRTLLQAVVISRTAILVAVIARLYPRLFRD